MVKKKSKHRNVADRGTEQLLFKEEGQHYAQATKVLGSGRFIVICDDGIERIGKLRGSMRRSEWVSVGTLVLISLRDFGDHASDKADILHRYSDTAAKQLRKYGELEWLEEKKRRECASDEDEEIIFDDGSDLDIDDV